MASSTQNTAETPPTMNVIQLCGSSTGPCGYCNGSRASIVEKDAEHSSKSYGVLIASMEPADYEALLHKGWRRSGIHLYKPNNWNSCCPALTIRLQTTRFMPSPAQERVVSKLERALNGEHVVNVNNKKKKRRTQDTMQVDPNVLGKLQTATLERLKQILALFPEYLPLLNKQQDDLVRFKVKPDKKKKRKKEDVSSVTLVCSICASLAGKSKGVLKRDTLARSLASALQQNAIESVLSVSAHEPSGQVLVSVSNDIVTNLPEEPDDSMSISPTNPIQEWLETTAEPPYTPTITTVDAHTSSLQPDVHKLYFKYQQAVHGDPDPLSDIKRDDDEDDNEEDWGEASSDFVDKVKAMLQREYSPDNAEKMYGPFSNFYRFLVESPIPYDGTYGTVHYHYRINGKLIAIGVVDKLPQGLSSVYAIYDPSQRITALGKYLSLKEIEYASPQYYYLGYYIESCQKMRYKAEYQPSELLCPTTYKWVDAAEAQATLLRDSPRHHVCTLYKGGSSKNGKDDKKISNGNKSNGESSTNHSTRTTSNQNVVNQLRLELDGPSLLTVSMLHPNGQAIIRPLMEEFVREMGPELACRFVIKLV